MAAITTAVHFATTVSFAVTGLDAVNALAYVVSVYQPSKVNPVLVGSAGKVIDVPVGTLAIGASLLPPWLSKLTV